MKDVGTGNLLKELYEAGFTETNTKALSQVSRDLGEISTEGRRFLDLMDTETKKNGKNYQLPLPFKNLTLSLPKNKKVGEKRLISLKNQFLRDSKYWSDYKLFIHDLLTKGYAKKSAGVLAEGNCWYIPHHGVYNLNKPIFFFCLVVVPNKMTGH